MRFGTFHTYHWGNLDKAYSNTFKSQLYNEQKGQILEHPRGKKCQWRQSQCYFIHVTEGKILRCDLDMGERKQRGGMDVCAALFVSKKIFA